MGPRTRFLLLNSPHNPTGTVLTRDELAAVAAVAIEHDLVVITDEVYEHLTFDDHEHVPLATLPGMFERTLTLSSAGKSYSFTGWKVGWATGPEELVGAVLAAKQWLTFTSGSPLQPAVAHALDETPDFPRLLAAELQERRDLLCAGLTKVGLDVRPRGHVLRHRRRLRARLGGRDVVLPRAARACRRRRDPRARSSSTTPSPAATWSASPSASSPRSSRRGSTASPTPTCRLFTRRTGDLSLVHAWTADLSFVRA